MGRTWLDWIVQAFQDLGGKATYPRLYRRLREIRPEPFSPEWEATVRQAIEAHSSDSDNYKEGSRNLFYSVGGIGSGHWGLRQDADLSGVVKRSTLGWRKIELAEALARCKKVSVEKVLPAVEKAGEAELQGWRRHPAVKAALAAIRAEKAAKALAESEG